MFLILAHRGATAAAESASAEATHGQFAHRLPDAVNKAGTGRALRVMRSARTAQQKFNIPVERSTGRIQNQPASAYFVPVKQKMKEVICPSLIRGMAGEYPGKPGIWEHWHAPVQLRRLLHFHSCGTTRKKEKPGLILGFRYVPLRVQEPGGAINNYKQNDIPDYPDRPQ